MCIITGGKKVNASQQQILVFAYFLLLKCCNQNLLIWDSFCSSKGKKLTPLSLSLLKAICFCPLCLFSLGFHLLFFCHRKLKHHMYHPWRTVEDFLSSLLWNRWRPQGRMHCIEDRVDMLLTQMLLFHNVEWAILLWDQRDVRFFGNIGPRNKRIFE